MEYTNEYIERLSRLATYKRGKERAVHKPLLLLLAIAKLFQGQGELAYTDVETPLSSLLYQFGRSTKGKPAPQYPFWHLCSDELWEIPDQSKLVMQANKERPTVPSLRLAYGRLEPVFAEALLADRNFARRAVETILECHFAGTLHEDLVAAVGLQLPEADRVSEPTWETSRRRQRDPRFNADVLEAYGHTCAVTGFTASMGGRVFGCDAAHIQAHCYSGPDVVENGLALSPTAHRLFDRGAWGLDDDLRVIVSGALDGTGPTIEKLRSMRGQEIRAPHSGFPRPSLEFVRWHRETSQGGVFKAYVHAS